MQLVLRVAIVLYTVSSIYTTVLLMSTPCAPLLLASSPNNSFPPLMPQHSFMKRINVQVSVPMWVNAHTFYSGQKQTWTDPSGQKHPFNIERPHYCQPP